MGLVPFIGSGAQLYWSGNGHYYQLVMVTRYFNDAVTLAASSNYLGLPGHLVTITSAEEKAFVDSLTGGRSYWIAGSTSLSADTWKWVDGPENGQSINSTFWPSIYNLVAAKDLYLYSNKGLWQASSRSSFYYCVIEYECPLTPSSSGPCARKSLAV